MYWIEVYEIVIRILMLISKYSFKFYLIFNCFNYKKVIENNL